jgi:hypothetical protein
MAWLDQATLGLAADPLPSPAAAASKLPDPVITPDDPTDVSGLELLPNCRWAVQSLVCLVLGPGTASAATCCCGPGTSAALDCVCGLRA